MNKNNDTGTAAPAPHSDDWKALISPYQHPAIGRALWQLVNTLGSYGLLWFFLYHSRDVSWWLTLPLAVLAGLLLVRVFIFFHDCGHGSFLPSDRANRLVGFVTGLLTFTPYHHWRWEHAQHHATAGNLDRRGVGDIWTLTVREYLAASRWRRLSYRLARHPVVLFGLAPLYLFVIAQRVPSPQAPRRERLSVWWMNLALLGMIAILGYTFGFRDYLILQGTILLVSGSIGIWMFYVQHQFEDAYWARRNEWDYTTAALQGSSYYKLPRVLQWLTGNIGFHHVHHLSARIPNYNLERCHRSLPLFQQVRPLTFLASLRSLTFRLWDEERRQLVGFRHLKQWPQSQ